ncbi:hypothetical protein QTP88_025170 [Uroleucon formosanum]
MTKEEPPQCLNCGFNLTVKHLITECTKPVMNNLKPLSLADRRIEANLAVLHKLIDGRVDAPFLLSLINFKVPTHFTRSNSSFVVPFHSTNYGKNNPIHRMMRICNEHLGFS